MQWELSRKQRLGLVALWLVVTFSLSAWWMLLGMRQSSELHQVRMFFWEGSILLLFVSVGGALLFRSVFSEQQRSEDVRRFFSTFTHELKTSLTSLRLQAEILEEDPRNRENENLRRLLRDVVRLELQLENALVLAQAEKGRLFLEEIPLQKTLTGLLVHWPQLQLRFDGGEAKLRADQRALECILKNLLQNAFVHGGASWVRVRMETPAPDRLKVLLADNGRGFSGRHEELGLAFTRHTTRSGAGIGLYLSRLLAQRMGGRLRFAPGSEGGLDASLELPGRLA